MSFQYLLVSKMNYSAFRDYLRWYIAASIKMGDTPYKSQTTGIPFFGHTEILHILASVGSTALAAAVVLPRYGSLNYVCGINED